MSTVFLGVAALAMALALVFAAAFWFVVATCDDSRDYECAPIQTRRPLLSRAWRALRLTVLRWELRCVVEERAGYLETGIVGIAYLRNSRDVELRLRRRILNLEMF
jgi:hypothetical protein